MEKKIHKPATRVIYGNDRQVIDSYQKNSSSTPNEQQIPTARTKERTAQPPKSAIKRVTRPSREVVEQKGVAQHPKVSRGVKDRLAADDAEIQALERALGINNKSSLPKAFGDEGLEDLLEGLDEANGDDILKKRKRSDDGSEWLEAKRRKAQGLGSGSAEPASNSEDEDHGTGGESATEESFEESEDEGSEESLSSFDDNDEKVLGQTRVLRERENPYVAPVAPDTASKVGKYIPPSLRVSTVSEGEDLSRLRRQVQGLINRLSDANLIAILGDVEKLYRDHPRQHVVSTLAELLCTLILDPSALQDTFIILHAGFVSAIFKVIGADFGALMVRESVAQFDSFYKIAKEGSSIDKRLRNVVAFLAHLYIFQVVGSILIYDLIRLFLQNISEGNTELLLKIVQSKDNEGLAHYSRITNYLRCWPSTSSG